MPFNVATLKAQKTVMPASGRGRAPRDLGPNPWLDKEWPFSVQNSYDNAEPYEITVAGTLVTGKVLKGPRKDEPVDRLTGDAQDACTLIRAAATKLNLGVSIRTYVGKSPDKNGNLTVTVPKGQVLIKYQAQKRKAARKPKTAAPTSQALTDQVQLWNVAS